MKMWQKRKGWIFLSVVVLIAIQFFWVLAKYPTIESGKVFYWGICYALPVSFLVGLYYNKQLTKMLFYSSPKRRRAASPSKYAHFWNRFSSQFLIVCLGCMLFYDTLIQTNDWFSSDKRHTFHERILSVNEVQHARSRKSWFGGNVTYDVTFEYRDELIVISCRESYHVGDAFDKTLNIGGLWGIWYED